MAHLGTRPGRADIYIRRNQNFKATTTLKVDGAVVNLTGYTATADIRRAADDVLAFTMTSTGGSPTITLGGVAGTVVFNVPVATVDDLSVGVAYIWDLKLTPSGGGPEVWLAGKVTVEEGVTV